MNREFGERFGDKAYSFEELVAELSAAFLCAELQITNTPRPDHAQYIANWLAVLKGDTKAIFTAASMATRAVDYLCSLQPSPALACEPGVDPAPGDGPGDGASSHGGTPSRPAGETAADDAGTGLPRGPR